MGGHKPCTFRKLVSGSYMFTRSLIDTAANIHIDNTTCTTKLLIDLFNNNENTYILFVQQL